MTLSQPIKYGIIKSPQCSDIADFFIHNKLITSNNIYSANIYNAIAMYMFLFIKTFFANAFII